MWKKWFPTYRIPKGIEDLVEMEILEDRTSGRDVTPRFETDIPWGTLVLWVDHPDPRRRYLGDSPRYVIDYHERGQLPETLLETDSSREAVAFMLESIEEGKGFRLLE